MRPLFLAILVLTLLAGCTRVDTGSAAAQSEEMSDSLSDPTQTLADGIEEDLGDDGVTLWSDGTYKAAVDVVANGRTQEHLSLSARLEAGAILSMKSMATGKLIEGFEPGKIDALGSTEIVLPNGLTYRVQLEEPFLSDSTDSPNK